MTKTDEEVAGKWAEEHYASALVDMKGLGLVLFAKQLALEAFLAGCAYARSQQPTSDEIEKRSRQLRTKMIVDPLDRGED